VILPPRGVYLAAFVSKLPITCAIRSASTFS
jgi:hypothetical protein